MFRLRKTDDKKISVGIVRRTDTPTKIFIAALSCSLLLHSSGLLFFRVKQTYPTVSRQVPTPIVFTAYEGTTADLFPSPQAYEHPFQKVLQEFHLIDFSKRSYSIPPVEPTFTNSLPPLPRIPTVPWELVDHLSTPRHEVRTYPIKINLHRDLHNLRLVDDASSCFRLATNETLFASSEFSESHPKVEFYVDIDSSSGQIVQALCHKELIDKRLQDLAEVLLKKLKFVPIDGKRKEKISGRLSMQFAGTFDVIGPLIDGAAFS